MTADKTLETALALVQNLYSRTREGEIDWHDTGLDRTFEATLGDYSLLLTQVPDRDYPDQPDYQLRVLSNVSQKEVERISNTSLRPVMDRSTEEGLNPYNLLDRTYELARRKALGVDRALESILESLTKKSSA